MGPLIISLSHWSKGDNDDLSSQWRRGTVGPCRCGRPCRNSSKLQKTNDRFLFFFVFCFNFREHKKATRRKKAKTNGPTSMIWLRPDGAENRRTFRDESTERFFCFVSSSSSSFSVLFSLVSLRLVSSIEMPRSRFYGARPFINVYFFILFSFLLPSPLFPLRYFHSGRGPGQFRRVLRNRLSPRRVPSFFFVCWFVLFSFIFCCCCCCCFCYSTGNRFRWASTHFYPR